MEWREGDYGEPRFVHTVDSGTEGTATKIDA